MVVLELWVPGSSTHMVAFPFLLVGRDEEKLPLVFPTGVSRGSVDLCSRVFVSGHTSLFLSTKRAFTGKAP